MSPPAPGPAGAGGAAVAGDRATTAAGARAPPAPGPRGAACSRSSAATAALPALRCRAMTAAGLNEAADGAAAGAATASETGAGTLACAGASRCCCSRRAAISVAYCARSGSRPAPLMAQPYAEKSTASSAVGRIYPNGCLIGSDIRAFG